MSWVYRHSTHPVEAMPCVRLQLLRYRCLGSPTHRQEDKTLTLVPHDLKVACSLSAVILKAMRLASSIFEGNTLRHMAPFGSAKVK